MCAMFRVDHWKNQLHFSSMPFPLPFLCVCLRFELQEEKDPHQIEKSVQVRRHLFIF